MSSDEKTSEIVVPVADKASPDANAAGTEAKLAADTMDEAAAAEKAEEKVPATEDAPQAAKTPVNDAKAEAADADKDASAEAFADELKSDGNAEDSDKADVEMAPSGSSTGATSKDEVKATPVKADLAEEAEPSTPTNEAGAPTPSKSQNRTHRKATPAQKKLNKKNSRARILHIEAEPGNHFFHKLKGHPKWPVIICDDSMLPEALLRSRPVSAKRQDGTYREDYADGGKRAQERNFPVMYLHTNEFGWVLNTDLIELDSSALGDVKKDKMRKDLQEAYKLAEERHPLEFYKEVLEEHQRQLEAAEEAAAEAAERAKTRLATPGKKKVRDEDAEMEDLEDSVPAKKKDSKKRKAEESIETPQRSESVKKTKIKLTSGSTPKVANGTPAAHKSSNTLAVKSARQKTKKAQPEDKNAQRESSGPARDADAGLTPEAREEKKKKEVLFLRHKLQKGLLTRDQEPKEEEMKTMSDFLSKLESDDNLEGRVIRETKINKVLKAILKLNHIPKEEEFNFKSRSTALLERWSKVLDEVVAPATRAEPSNGVNGTTGVSKANGVKNHEAEAGETKTEKASVDDANEKSC